MLIVKLCSSPHSLQRTRLHKVPFNIKACDADVLLKIDNGSLSGALHLGT